MRRSSGMRSSEISCSTSSRVNTARCARVGHYLALEAAAYDVLRRRAQKRASPALGSAAKQDELLPQREVLEREVSTGSERRTERAQQNEDQGHCLLVRTPLGHRPVFATGVNCRPDDPQLRSECRRSPRVAEGRKLPALSPRRRRPPNLGSRCQTPGSLLKGRRMRLAPRPGTRFRASTSRRHPTGRCGAAGRVRKS